MAFRELELRFASLNTKIENKTSFLENFYKESIELVNERFNNKNLEIIAKKHSDKLNNLRLNLIKKISVNLRSEINRVNKFQRTNEENANIRTYLGIKRRLNFKSSAIKSESACLRKFLMKGFKFGSKFSALQLIKYQDILDISKYLVKEDDFLDWDESLINATGESKTSLEIFRLMIDGGANVNAIDKWSGITLTPLMLASVKGRLDIVKYLVDNGSHVNAQDDCENTALILASDNGSVDIVKFLVENGADVNAANENSDTALLLAAENEHLEMVKYLVENRANVDVMHGEDYTALMIASEKGNLEIVKYLSENGADVNVTNKWNETSLLLASAKGHFGIVKYFVEIGADFSSTDRNKALLNASLNGYSDIVEYLI